MASIDVTLLDKTKFKETTRKNGDKAIFCELVLIETPDGQYGDYMVKQGISKEERESGKQMPILGNGKVFQRRGGPPSPKAAPSDSPPPF